MTLPDGNHARAKTKGHHRMSTGSSEPKCCDEPMVHNSFTRQFECLSAYSVLHEHGVDPYLVDPRDLSLRLRDEWEHWNGSRCGDGQGESA